MIQISKNIIDELCITKLTVKIAFREIASPHNPSVFHHQV